MIPTPTQANDALKLPEGWSWRSSIDGITHQLVSPNGVGIGGSALDDIIKEFTALAAERRKVERLREALKVMVYETTHLSPEQDDGSHKCRIPAYALATARAALQDEQQGEPA